MKIVDIFLQSYFKFSAAIESGRMRLPRVLTFLILPERSQIILLLRLTFPFYKTFSLSLRHTEFISVLPSCSLIRRVYVVHCAKDDKAFDCHFLSLNDFPSLQDFVIYPIVLPN